MAATVLCMLDAKAVEAECLRWNLGGGLMTFWDVAGDAASIAGLVSFPAAAAACIPIYLGWGHKLFLAKKATVSVLLAIGFVGYVTDLNARFGWFPIEPAVYDDYKPIYAANSQLGKPLAPVSRQQHVYEAIYDHAIVLWIETLHSPLANSRLKAVWRDIGSSNPHVGSGWDGENGIASL